MHIIKFALIFILLKAGLALCEYYNVNNSYEGKQLKVVEHFNYAQNNNISNKIDYFNSNPIKGKTLSNKSNNKETNLMKKTSKKTVKKSKVSRIKPTKQQFRSKVDDEKVKTVRKVKRKSIKKPETDESKSVSNSKSDDSEEPKFQLGEGETLLDFSALAKIKSLDMDDVSKHASGIKEEIFTRDNPLLNWNCTSLSLEEEQNISSGYLDKKISYVITNAEDFPEGGTQLLDDMRQYYCYLKHINQLVINQVKRGKVLMKKLVEEDPEFIQIGFDTDELTEQFSWVKEEAEAFEYIMDGICYQWKCMVARVKH